MAPVVRYTDGENAGNQDEKEKDKVMVEMSAAISRGVRSYRAAFCTRKID